MNEIKEIFKDDPTLLSLVIVVFIITTIVYLSQRLYFYPKSGYSKFIHYVDHVDNTFVAAAYIYEILIKFAITIAVIYWLTIKIENIIT